MRFNWIAEGITRPSLLYRRPEYPRRMTSHHPSDGTKGDRDSIDQGLSSLSLAEIIQPHLYKAHLTRPARGRCGRLGSHQNVDACIRQFFRSSRTSFSHLRAPLGDCRCRAELPFIATVTPLCQCFRGPLGGDATSMSS
jgi:hypothetical protein